MLNSPMKVPTFQKGKEEREDKLRPLLDFERCVVIQEEKVIKIEECLRRLLKRRKKFPKNNNLRFHL